MNLASLATETDDDVAMAVLELQRALVAREQARDRVTPYEMSHLRHRVDRARVMLDLALMEAS